VNLLDLPSLSPKLCFFLLFLMIFCPLFARSGPPFVIRSVLIGSGSPGLQMVHLSERENGVWGRERGYRATQNPKFILKVPSASSCVYCEVGKVYLVMETYIVKYCLIASNRVVVGLRRSCFLVVLTQFGVYSWAILSISLWTRNVFGFPHQRHLASGCWLPSRHFMRPLDMTEPETGKLETLTTPSGLCGERLIFGLLQRCERVTANRRQRWLGKTWSLRILPS